MKIDTRELEKKIVESSMRYYDGLTPLMSDGKVGQSELLIFAESLSCPGRRHHPSVRGLSESL